MRLHQTAHLCLAIAAVLILGVPGGVVHAAASVYMAPEELAAVAPIIVEARVTRTASGYDAETGGLSTYVTLEVEHWHRGQAMADEIIVREPGGSYGALEHFVDAVPVYAAGERVLAFLEPARDGSLRTAGMFFGKFTLDDGRSRASAASRSLSGHGLILGRGGQGPTEILPLADLAAVVVTNPYSGTAASSTILPRPPEWGRLLWEGERTATGVTVALAGRGPASYFTALSSTNPTRWSEADSGTAVSVDIERAGNPLGNGAATVTQVQRAMAAWNEVVEARLVLQTGNDDTTFYDPNGLSPTAASPAVNIMLFDDPWSDIADPSGCSGVLAIGGYWRFGSPLITVNNVTFKPAFRLYVIFNNNFTCFLGNADNLAEVSAHELGHGIGFGHSTVTDALMRASAYGGGRGPRLGEDDKDGAHCHYPHSLGVAFPAGGESLAPGSLQTISWTSTTDPGNEGTVDLELSLNAGVDWSPIAQGTGNDGAFSWTVPATTSTQARVRVVRPNRIIPSPSPYPDACSQAVSAGLFTIGSAGTVPDGSTAAPLMVEDAGGGMVNLTWSASCSGTATDHAIYSGSLVALQSGVWDHAPLTCSAGADLAETVAAGSGLRYYLVAPRMPAAEGWLGNASSGSPRPAAAAACLPREPPTCP